MSRERSLGHADGVRDTVVLKLTATAEGIRAARGHLSEPIDAVLLDIRLKDGDGLDLLDELQWERSGFDGELV